MENLLDNKIKISLKDLKNKRCICGSILFESAYVIKEISKLLSPNSQNTTIPIQIFICKKCGKVLDELEEIMSDNLNSNIINELR